MKRTRVWITEEEADMLREVIIVYKMDSRTPWDDRRIRLITRLKEKTDAARERMAGMR